ncbi:hypothetical protein SeMB42_g00579 [Synchytrium endobioticum]|uniref:Uncharacterized protein n=1 Tax=Synchytrium endobioticum TaxID=286115 RepID=A0A507DGN0_9FUNG|nr:hypothetical protein SeLEV6574_g01137 [Synchytrium endobioticum]TPX53895.1 hypothetical protein SeMB42_g00579 [Synchytrium endobioticum]
MMSDHNIILGDHVASQPSSHPGHSSTFNDLPNTLISAPSTSPETNHHNQTISINHHLLQQPPSNSAMSRVSSNGSHDSGAGSRTSELFDIFGSSESSPYSILCNHDMVTGSSAGAGHNSGSNHTNGDTGGASDVDDAVLNATQTLISLHQNQTPNHSSLPTPPLANGSFFNNNSNSVQHLYGLPQSYQNEWDSGSNSPLRHQYHLPPLAPYSTHPPIAAQHHHHLAANGTRHVPYRSTSMLHNPFIHMHQGLHQTGSPPPSSGNPATSVPGNGFVGQYFLNRYPDPLLLHHQSMLPYGPSAPFFLPPQTAAPRMHVNPTHINVPDARAAASRGSLPSPALSHVSSTDMQPPHPVFPDNPYDFLRMIAGISMPIGPHIIQQARDLVDARLAELQVSNGNGRGGHASLEEKL